MIDKTQFPRQVSSTGSQSANLPSTTGKMRLIERFTRTDPETILYEFTVDDPAIYTRPWTAQLTMWKSESRIFEYACHEGNYALPHTITGALAEEEEAAAAAKKGR